MRRLLRNLIILALAVLLIPYVIAPLYRFVDPVSTPMLWRWLTGKRVVHITVPLNRIAPALRLAEFVRLLHRLTDGAEIHAAIAAEAAVLGDNHGEAQPRRNAV